ncbi:MAG TPA: thioredoxin family protein [Balneolaceae bacterium]|nr:thioredoxin family protein [Balneola sp.]HBQ59600.1 thioredoxin family protein [Balneolaceae bacterium]|tara:strand:- start:34841 stop:35455 length:615 start_codon:yes stop_codon:yes gene_type:complete
MTTTTQVITLELLEKAVDYKTHLQHIADLFEQGRTTNEDNRENMLDYTKMYLQRVGRWDRRGKLNVELIEKLESFPRKMIWLVLNEGWCGDSAQTLPFINKMAEMSDNISLRLILRDQNLDVMDEFLTNGGRSIPKLIALDADSLDVMGTWGPRPKEAYELYKIQRDDPEIPNEKAMENLHLWYAKDRGKSIQQEFSELLDDWA